MFSSKATPRRPPPAGAKPLAPSSPPAQPPPVQRWENEGGAPAHAREDRPNASQRERIQARAYELFLSRQRDGRPGSDADDWAQAEREIGEGPPPPVHPAHLRS
ncbi:MAG TPA: DUF2934 domain-containing protein [Phycisphaerales bacterium]|nr:DUF2934 domain-containing protein [Phycisphaerales bacterium]